ncbi:lipopolysaccharide biosynthesis protein [Tistrella mobilis]|uniref:Succinoglycan transport protein n=1 Tax=Tistrella mobilis (strain KA081020-065) TaxID=1110502 RepID=I3TH78_TISMK|nr:lipopolysaccharide biosynthesis protein [Tistrella mobilis]AFK52116.1 putative succinoglycan transport protein [Tistrella mobilis KA081020-065]
MTEPVEGIGKTATRSVGWSMAQNWGGRFFTFALFVVLARLLTPHDFGVVSAANIVLLFIAMVSDFGFGEAIVQRRNMKHTDVNLPFFFSLFMSLTLAFVVSMNAEIVSGWLNVEGVEIVLATICFIAPLTTLSQFQEYNYRKQLRFKALAFRVFVANIIAGAASIATVLAGFGIWALVVQMYVTILVSLIWLWSMPVWKPTFTLDFKAFRELARFGFSVVTMRVFDFLAQRFVEFFVIGRYGVAIFGLYAVGARVYQIMMQLLQGALSDASLAVLSTIAHNRAKMAELYLKTIVISNFLFAPVFCFVAALSPEISLILFGAKWEGVEDIMRPLMILGAVQCSQFMNGPFLSAMGRPSLVMYVSAIKNLAAPIALLTIPSAGVADVAMIWAFSQFLGTPFSFGLTARELKVPILRVILNAAPAVLGCVAADLAVDALRDHLSSSIDSVFLMGIVLGASYFAVYGMISCSLGYRQVKTIVTFVRNRMNSR